MNYGDYNGALRSQFPPDRFDWIDNPFPGGECCLDVERRMKSFLDECLTPKANVAVVSHQFPQLALEVLLNGRDWREAISEDWRDSGDWQPGWTYRIID